MQPDHKRFISRPHPKSVSIPRLSASIHHTPYPRSPQCAGVTSTRYRLSDFQWTEREDALKTKETLVRCLDAQMMEKEKARVAAMKAERKNDMEALGRWRMEATTERQMELREKMRKKQDRVMLEKEYEREFKTRVGAAAKERAEDEAHVRHLIKQAQAEVLQQESVKKGFRRMFQDLIRVNEQQKMHAVVLHEAERKRDAQLQHELAMKLAAQDEEREKALKDRVLKAQIFLDGDAARSQGRSKVSNQEMYRRVLDKQVREHRLRDWDTWRRQQMGDSTLRRNLLS